MPKITLEEQKDYTVLPVDSILYLTVTEVTVREVQGARPWEKLEFTFQIDGIQAIGNGDSPELYQSAVGTKIWGSVPFRLTDSSENRLRLWAESILGMELGLGFELDTDNFINRKVRGVTSQYNKKNINPATGRPFVGNQIQSLLPMGGVSPAQASQPVSVSAPQGVPSPEDPPF